MPRFDHSIAESYSHGSSTYPGYESSSSPYYRSCICLSIIPSANRIWNSFQPFNRRITVANFMGNFPCKTRSNVLRFPFNPLFIISLFDSVISLLFFFVNFPYPPIFIISHDYFRIHIVLDLFVVYSQSVTRKRFIFICNLIARCCGTFLKLRGWQWVIVVVENRYQDCFSISQRNRSQLVRRVSKIKLPMQTIFLDFCSVYLTLERVGENNFSTGRNEIFVICNIT